MDLSSIFQDISKKFTIRRDVEFKELGIKLVLETPSTEDELKVTEACSQFDGGAYIDQLRTHSVAITIRKINDIEFNSDEVEYTDETGNKQKKSRYLFLLDYVKKWPSPVRNMLFDIFTNMHAELEEKLKTTAKFEVFSLTTLPEEKSEDQKFKRVEEAKA